MIKKQFRPALAAFVLMVAMSLLTTAVSFLVAPVCEDLGFSRASFILYYSFLVAAGAVSSSFLGAYMNKRGTRGIVLFSGIWVGLGCLGLSFSSQLWMFYVLGAAIGLFGVACLILAANVIVQKTYPGKNAAAILGVVMTGAGVGGVIWSNFMPPILEAMGWRFGYRLLGVLWFALAMLAVLILGKQEITNSFNHSKAGMDNGVSRKEALKNRRFYLVITVMCVITICSCVSQHLPSILGEMGHDSTMIGLLVSVMTAASAVGTILEGVVCSKVGIRRTLMSVLILYAVGYCLMSLNSGIYLALVFLALGSGSQGTLMPVVVRTLFGSRDYAAIWSIVVTCGSIASFLASPAWGMVYDLSGSYRPALVAMPVLLAAALLCLLGALKNVKE